MDSGSDVGASLSRQHTSTDEIQAVTITVRVIGEKFNQTAQSQILRGLPGAADVDADCGALELRLSHFLAYIFLSTYSQLARSAAKSRNV